MNKYDRQIRLWSHSGQEALKDARILVIGVTAASTELIKNVVLAGIGKVCIMDSGTVQSIDLHSNFFMRDSDLGKKRARVTAELLGELNPEVEIQPLLEPLSSYTELGTDFWSEFSAVVCCSVVNIAKLTAHLANILSSWSLPTMQIDSYGFYGRVRLYYKEHCVIETHPESLNDLRFVDPTWPELEKLVEALDLDKMLDYAHENVPYFTIISRALAKWESAHEGRGPSSAADKRDFKKLLAEMARKPDEENFVQALHNVWRVWSPVVQPGLQRLLHADAIVKPTSQFWLLCATLRNFVDGPGCGYPPLSGEIPDMRADTESFVALKKLYQEKAMHDCEVFYSIYKRLALLTQFEQLPKQVIKTFCRNCRFLRVLYGKSVENDVQSILRGYPETKASDPLEFEHTNVFLAIEAANRYVQENSESPSWPITEAQATLFAHLAADIIDERLDESTYRVIGELTRSGGGEIASVSTVLGAIGAQEIMKMVMNQYTPIAHTIVYDAANETSYTFTTGEIVN